MITSNKKIVQQIVLSCIKNGVKKVVISPGSRNAPLSIAFDACDYFDCLVIHDERSAAFFGMGIAEELKEPVALVCTSGSALLNYYPAIAEAYYREIPLVVISADRPPEWIDHGDGQTIVQENVYANHVLHHINLNDSVQNNSYIENSKKLIQNLFNTCLANRKGPVQINLGLSEPLYETEETEMPEIIETPILDEKKEISKKDLEILKEDLSNSKILILVGQGNFKHRTKILLSELAKNTNIAVLVENTSNFVDHQFNHCIDRSLALISKEKQLEYVPDILITLGGAIISKKIKQFLRKYKAKKHYRVSHAFPNMDTYRCLYKCFDCSADSFIKTLDSINFERNTINYGPKWKELDYLAKDKSEAYYEKITYSDLSVFNEITKNIPKNSIVHMANSSVVRYFQLFDPYEDLRYHCNRGTSGIDGSSSTAFGAAYATPGNNHVLITGDVSFFYDSNALWNSYLKPNIKVILINNSGGGIFNIISGPANSPLRAKYFEATHEHSAEYLCKAFNFKYQKILNEKDLDKDLNKFLNKENKRPSLLEIFTPRLTNADILNDYFKHLSK